MFVQSRFLGLPKSGPFLKTQALRFGKHLNKNLLILKARKGWVNRFKHCHIILPVFVLEKMWSANADAARERER